MKNEWTAQDVGLGFQYYDHFRKREIQQIQNLDTAGNVPGFDKICDIRLQDLGFTFFSANT